MAAVNSQSIGLQLEKVRPNLQTIFWTDDTFFSKIESRPMEKVSYRNYRVPMELLNWGNSNRVNLDGGNLYRGGGPVDDAGLLGLVEYDHPIEWTERVEYATDSPEKAIANYVKRLVKGATKTFRHNLDTLAIRGQSADVMGVVTGYNSGTGVISIDTPASVQDYAQLQVWSALGGTNRGTYTVLSVDNSNNALYPTAIPTFTPVAGDLLLMNGASGTAASGLAGIQTYQVTGNTGTVLGLPRSSYPGKLSTPYVDGGNASLTPAYGRLLLNAMRIANSENAGSDDGVWFMNIDQEAAWENTGQVVTQNIINQNNSDTSIDMLKRNPPKTMAGYPILTSLKQTPGRIDFLRLKHWFRIMGKDIDWYDTDSGTTFPIYGSDGAPSSAKWSALVVAMNIGNEDVRSGAYGANLLTPSGYYGH